MARRPGSTQSMLLDVARVNGQITLKGLQSALGFEGANGYARISRAALDLMKSGHLVRVAPGTYRYVEKRTDLDYSKGQSRMVRVIRIRTKMQEPFTSRKLSELSDCSLDWSKRYVRFLFDKGLLIRVGFERAGRTKAPSYLGVEDRLNEDWPAMRRRKKTSEVDSMLEQVREKAYQVARVCQADPESLQFIRGALSHMADLVENVMKKAK